MAHRRRQRASGSVIDIDLSQRPSPSPSPAGSCHPNRSNNALASRMGYGEVGKIKLPWVIWLFAYGRKCLKPVGAVGAVGFSDLSNVLSGSSQLRRKAVSGGESYLFLKGRPNCLSRA